MVIYFIKIMFSLLNNQVISFGSSSLLISFIFSHIIFFNHRFIFFILILQIGTGKIEEAEVEMPGIVVVARLPDLRLYDNFKPACQRP